MIGAMGRVLSWFSCGAASAVTAKLAVDKYGDRCEVLYCDTFAYEHPDNRRTVSNTFSAQSTTTTAQKKD